MFLWIYLCVLIAIVAMGYDLARPEEVTIVYRFFLQFTPLVCALLVLILKDRGDDPDYDPYPGSDEEN